MWIEFFGCAVKAISSLGVRSPCSSLTNKCVLSWNKRVHEKNYENQRVCNRVVLHTYCHVALPNKAVLVGIFLKINLNHERTWSKQSLMHFLSSRVTTYSSNTYISSSFLNAIRL
jgi:hypothetical protein